MKHLKKIVSLLLTAVMVLAMCIPVMADAATTYSITIDNAAEDHIYEAYQIFAGELSTDGLSLSNIVWGSGVSEVGKTHFNDAKTKAETLKNEADAKAFAKEVSKYLATPAGEANKVTNGEYVINNLTSGYYLIKDKDDSLSDKNDTYTSYILKVVKNISVKPKSDKPSSEKKVKDVNDSTGDESNWQDSADYDIGDAVPFQLKGTVASNYDEYTTYKFIFHDKESAGLTFLPNTVKVYVDNINSEGNIETTEITSGFTVKQNVQHSENDVDTFDVEFANLKEISGVKASSVIRVEYSSTLNDNAVIGSIGNPNKMHLEYSNNPNDAQGGETGNTPDDKVIVFTYKVTANKTDSKGNALKGAAFALYKKDVNNKYNLVSIQNAIENNGKYTLIDPNTTKFNWVGLDDGDYKIVEVVTPDGYNTMQDLLFTVTAGHEITSDDPRLTSLSGGDLFTGDVSKGTVTTDIKNYKGSELPSTGGIGTTIFYVVGVILMLGAGVLLVTKKRMSTNR